MARPASPKEYLASLPPGRRAVVSTLRDLIVRKLPKGYEEAIAYGMLAYQIPLQDYPETYNGQPLAYVCLAAQKNHYALYLNCVCQDSKLVLELKEAFQKAGKKMDMGKSCLRFKKLEDLPLDAIGKLVGAVKPKQYIAQYEATRV
jgi:hypothetical protein